MYTVLIVDDEVIERNYLKKVFQEIPEQFLVVGEARNGQEAIAIALEKKPSIIIMDINMPVYNGLIAAQSIKSNLINSIIILNSAYAEFEFARQAIDYNLDAYLLKPASEKEILDTVKSCLKRKRLDDSFGGNSLTLSQTISNDYPFIIIDQLLNAISSHDLKLIKINSNNYLNFLKSQKNNLESHRLYIINTIFSIERELQRTSTKIHLELLDFNRYLEYISTSEYWYEILNHVVEFFERLSMLYSDNLIGTQNCADMIALYIDKNYQNHISLDVLSDIYHYSPSYLSRVFHQYKGLTMNNYIKQTRVNHALYLLKNSEIAINEISVSCGFINITHFNRVFKEITNKTPSQIRNEEI